MLHRLQAETHLRNQDIQRVSQQPAHSLMGAIGKMESYLHENHSFTSGHVAHVAVCLNTYDRRMVAACACSEVNPDHR